MGISLTKFVIFKGANTDNASITDTAIFACNGSHTDNGYLSDVRFVTDKGSITDTEVYH